MKIENVLLDENNVEFNNAAEFVQHTNSLIFLTGKAGTGKTTFLKYIRLTTQKNIVVVAPTGVAAINAGGVTINSFFQIPFGPFVPNDSRLRTSSSGTENKETIYSTFQYREEKKEIIKNLELLIIDEVSMVRCDTLDVIDRLLKVFRGKPYLPFGGVQVILIGDTFQLPPIAKSEQWSILNQFYKTPFFFSSQIIESNKPIYIELKKIYRQNEKDFIDLLNRIRIDKVTTQDFQVLNSKYQPNFTGQGNDYIILATHNKIVNETNLTKLNNLETPLFSYIANLTGTFPRNIMPTDEILKLKEGAQIMFIKNDTGEHKRYYNGKIGKIKELDEEQIVVEFDDERTVTVERTVWNNIKYTYNKSKKKVEEEVIGTFEQFPLKLAWAITVHKSQGLTFEKVIADLGRAFAAGQVYVALSRCTSFNGLILKTQLHSHAIKTSTHVLEFAKNETPNTLIVEELNSGKANFYYKESRKNFKIGLFKDSWSNFIKATKFRNDINTDLFKRYFLVYCNKLFSYKTKNKSLEKQNTNLRNQLYNSEKKIEQLNLNIVEKDKKLSSQNESIKLLLGKSRKDDEQKKELQNNLSDSRNESYHLKENLSNINKNYSQASNEVLRLNATINELNRKIKSNEIEITRLQKIKWHQKLFGKK